MDTSSRAKELVERRKRLQELRQLRLGGFQSRVPLLREDRPAYSPFVNSQSVPVTTAESIDNLVKKIEGDISISQKDVSSAVLQAKEVSSLKEKIDNLKEENNVISLSFPPTIVERYTKTIQTHNYDFDEEDTPKENDRRSVSFSKKPEMAMSHRSRESISLPAPSKEEKISSIVDDETRKTYLSNPGLNDFIVDASNVLERVINYTEDYDPWTNIKLDRSNITDSNEQVSVIGQFYNDTLCRKRVVTSVDWSPHHKEMFLTSYNQQILDQERWQTTTSSASDGVLLLWNVNMASRYEYSFTANSPILSAAFHPYNPFLIYGGLYNGKIVMWDIREKSTPVQSSDIRRNGHNAPIYSLDFIGGSASCSLLSGSTDGYACYWNPELIMEPNFVTCLQYSTKENATPSEFISISSVSVPDMNSSSFYVGSDNGMLHTIQTGSDKFTVTKSLHLHEAPILSMASHPNKTNKLKALGDVLLTASMDWTVKLWRPSSDEPLASFETSRNYIYGVDWSPVHPSLFADCNGSGDIEVWNIVDSVEQPVTVKHVTDKALSCVQFNENGHKLACGDSNGYVYLLDIKAETADPRPDEIARLQSTLDHLANEKSVGAL